MGCSTPSFQSERNGEATAAACQNACANPKQQRASDHIKQYSTCRQDQRSTENSNKKGNKATQTSGETKKNVPNLGASAATRRPKLENGSASFPKVVPSRVVVRNMSMNKADKAGMKAQEIVMEKDELNERIDAFFARFREQLRDSLSIDCCKALSSHTRWIFPSFTPHKLSSMIPHKSSILNLERRGASGWETGSNDS